MQLPWLTIANSVWWEQAACVLSGQEIMSSPLSLSALYKPENFSAPILIPNEWHLDCWTKYSWAALTGTIWFRMKLRVRYFCLPDPVQSRVLKPSLPAHQTHSAAETQEEVWIVHLCFWHLLWLWTPSHFLPNLKVGLLCLPFLTPDSVTWSITDVDFLAFDSLSLWEFET